MKFEIKNISKNIQASMMQKGVWSSECPISISKLRLLYLSHYNFENKVVIGRMIVLDSIAEAVISIFKELFELKFPIHNIDLIDKYNGDDELSMSENNSSCFNFRKIDGSELLSMHSYGLAIDINPIQNPFIQNGKVLPIEGSKYLNRKSNKKGMVESVTSIFYKHGFTVWGGNWETPIDYHHFQVPRDRVDDLIE